ncbi:sensor histidine kinase [Streptomyces sp. NA02950]|uniref:sensor histidine kinase n=1 Tax=Streptomyces sp. NA02950 TaxID=2742137 RepID=UPI0015908BDF|nr:sensor histidine kinase [Streptomyces sp. NA02950]QKV91606.1 sensor histidine kinase [Streptomyces sp. NA02950]
MPADVPLEEPSRRLTGPLAPDVYFHVYRRWDAYYAIVFVATLLFIVSGSDPGPGPRAVAAALFAAAAPWYVLVGRRVLLAGEEDRRRGLLYLAGLTVFFLLPSAFVGETRIALFALAPQCFILLRLRWALTAMASLNLLPVVAWALVRRPDPHDLFLNSLFAVVTLAFSAVLGSWIIMVIDQSRERAALIAELEASREEVARLSAAHGALAERERLSREIHDTLAQGFTSLLMLVQAVESEVEHDMPLARRHLDLMARTARENLAEARALVAGAGPADLDGGSLPDAVRRLAVRHEDQSGAPARVEVSGAVRPLPAAVEVVGLRTCQEALANVRRHAGPRAAVALELDYGENALRVRIRDTGRGFDPAVPHGGYGLAGLRARAREAGGTAEVRGVPGEGTTVAVELPVRAPVPAPVGKESTR